MHNKHYLRGPEPQHFAVVEEIDGEFRIMDGWNVGQITAAISFPNLNTTRWMLAGRWNVLYTTIELIRVEEVQPELSTDEKIVKMARHFHRGICTANEFLAQMDRIMAEDRS